MSKTKRVIGFKGVIDAIAKGAVTLVTVDPDRKDNAQVKKIIKSGVKIDWRYTPNSVEAEISLKNRDIDSVLRRLESQERATVIVLDHIQDTGNFGSIIRSADAFGVDLIIYPNSNSVQLTDVVIKISAGSNANLDIISVPNIVNIIEKLKKLGFWIYGTDSSGDFHYKKRYDNKSCIVMGNEHKGMKDSTTKACDFIINIPIRIESLNVSQACSIILCEISSQKDL